jgi:hypothetical protein
MLNVAMPNVAMPNVAMLNVVAPLNRASLCSAIQVHIDLFNSGWDLFRTDRLYAENIFYNSVLRTLLNPFYPILYLLKSSLP